MNTRVQGFPEGDVTVEFWARLPPAGDAGGRGRTPGPPPGAAAATLLSYATVVPVSDGEPLRGWMPDAFFADDALRVERYLTEHRGSPDLPDALDISTVGTVRVHVNSNRESNRAKEHNWVDFYTGW